MAGPTTIDLPHNLGATEAKRRLQSRIGELKNHIPGGAAEVESSWTGDQLNLDITAMGQKIAAQIDVQDSKVRCRVMLPGMLALFAAPIEAALSRKGKDLLLEDRSKRG